MSPLERLLSLEDGDLLASFLATVPPAVSLRFAQVSHTWASAAEVGMSAACARHGWKQPRRARLQRASQAFPWRALYVGRACRACLAVPGDFAVRTIDAGAPRLYLCGRCAKSARVVERLQDVRATLDVTGLSGKPLYSKKESKFCADVSRLSKESMDGASGARAELLRHGSGSGRRR